MPVKRTSTKKPTARKAKRPAKRRGAGAASTAPKPVKTGRGMPPLDVARTVLDLLAASRFDEVESKWLAPSLESVEGAGVALAWRGKKAVLAKYRAWEADHEVHESQIEGPWVGATGFCLKWKIDVTQKSTGQRHKMEEIAVYSVRDGKIVREEFHYRVG